VQSFNSVPLQYASAGSIGNPAESPNPGLLTVGAASWQTPTVIESFSSVGPTPDGRVKPDIVGADQASTVTYPIFGGTSQAAPHIAGLAALVKSAFPAYTPQQVASYLKSNAIPRGTGRPNNTWGWGFARLPNVCGATVSPTTTSIGQTGGSVQLTVATVNTCGWTASSQAPWLTFASAMSGTGSTTAVVNVAANTGAPRTGTLLVANVSITITQAGPAAPALYPRNLVASVSGTLVTLSWLAPESASPTGYVLEAGTQPGASDLASLNLGSTTYYSFDATPGLYYARVRGTFGATPGPVSNEVTFRIGQVPTAQPPPPSQPGPPSAPLGLRASVVGGNVSLGWSPPSNAAGLLGYQLEAGSAPGLANLVVTTTTAPGLYVTGVGQGTYYVRVRAGNAIGIGPPSNELTVVVNGPQPPAAPSGLAGLTSGTSVSLQWQAPTSGGAVTGYAILAGSRSGLADIARIPLGPATAVSVSGVPAGVYYVKIVATNALGSSSPSNEIVVVVR
jgi:hypothetical protein